MSDDLTNHPLYTPQPQAACVHGHLLSGNNLRITKAGRRRCVTCSRAEYVRSLEKSKRLREVEQPKKCLACGIVKPSSDFSPQRRRCKSCLAVRYRETVRAWNERNRNSLKLPARRKVRHEVRIGRLVKPPNCEECGEAIRKERLQGHHDDYSKPLAVRWLCSPCHGAAHGKGLNP